MQIVSPGTSWNVCPPDLSRWLKRAKRERKRERKRRESDPNGREKTPWEIVVGDVEKG